MKKSRILVLLTVLVVASLWAFREWQIYATAVKTFGSGPDVIVGDMPSTRRWGSVGGETSFSIGTTSCNIGDARLNWISNSNVHPVIPQSLYRVKNGRIEQLGTSWLKHGFAVAAGSLCGSCSDPSSVYLGVGCSDPYGASLNGSQSRLGPRSEVNATTGHFAWPHGNLPQTGTLDGRIRVFNADLDPAQNAGARYFAGSQYVHPEDAAAGNDLNNASYREIFVVNLGGGNFDLSFGAPQTVRQKPAILAWQAVHPDVQIFNVDIPGDGRVIVGVRSIPIEGGSWHTEIAVENLNSHQSVRSVGARFGSDVISNMGFRDVNYQFEPYSATNWPAVVSDNLVEWATQTFAVNQNANAIRWNTMYSFWCDSAGPLRTLELGLFRPGVVNEMTIDVVPVVLPAAHKLLDGELAGGQIADLFDSDNSYFELDPSPTKNLRKQKVDLTIQSTSLSESPTDLGFRLEAAMAGGPSGDVIQTIDLYNYDTGQYELVDMRAASSADETVEVSPTGDLSRFVQTGTNEITARIVWVSNDFSGKPFEWTVDVDQAIWLVD